MIAFSLKNPIKHQYLIKKIDDLIIKEVKNQEQAEKSLLVISIVTITDEQEEIKKLN